LDFVLALPVHHQIPDQKQNDKLKSAEIARPVGARKVGQTQMTASAQSRRIGDVCCTSALR
jgi:hypothetical protein